MKQALLALMFAAAVCHISASREPVFAASQTANFCLRVPVLMYHHIQPNATALVKKQTALSVDTKVFEQHMSYLSEKGYKSIDAKALVDALISRTVLPGKTVVITLDDAYMDAYTYAYPIARKYGMNLNIMVPTGLINNPDYLTWEQLKSMVGSGNVFVHNHTWSHANLGSASVAKQEFEINTASKQLEENLNIKSNILVYPYGSRNRALLGLVKQKGYIGGFSTVSGIMECSRSIMELPRIRVGNGPLSRHGI